MVNILVFCGAFSRFFCFFLSSVGRVVVAVFVENSLKYDSGQFLLNSHRANNQIFLFFFSFFKLLGNCFGNDYFLRQSLKNIIKWKKQREKKIRDNFNVRQRAQKQAFLCRTIYFCLIALSHQTLTARRQDKQTNMNMCVHTP